MRFKVVWATDPDLLEERLNRAAAELPADAVVVDVKLGSAPGGDGKPLFLALILYKRVEPWQD